MRLISLFATRAHFRSQLLISITSAFLLLLSIDDRDHMVQVAHLASFPGRVLGTRLVVRQTHAWCHFAHMICTVVWTSAEIVKDLWGSFFAHTLLRRKCDCKLCVEFSNQSVTLRTMETFRLPLLKFRWPWPTVSPWPTALRML